MYHSGRKKKGLLTVEEQVEEAADKIPADVPEKLKSSYASSVAKAQMNA